MSGGFPLALSSLQAGAVWHRKSWNKWMASLLFQSSVCFEVNVFKATFKEKFSLLTILLSNMEKWCLKGRVTVEWIFNTLYYCWRYTEICSNLCKVSSSACPFSRRQCPLTSKLGVCWGVGRTDPELQPISAGAQAFWEGRPLFPQPLCKNHLFIYLFIYS